MLKDKIIILKICKNPCTFGKSLPKLPLYKLDPKAELLQHRAKQLPHEVAAMTNPIGGTRPAIVVVAGDTHLGLAPPLHQERTRRRTESNQRRTRAMMHPNQVPAVTEEF